MDIDEIRKEKKRLQKKAVELQKNEKILIKECIEDIKACLDIQHSGLPKIDSQWISNVVKYRSITWMEYTKLVMFVFISERNILYKYLTHIKTSPKRDKYKPDNQNLFEKGNLTMTDFPNKEDQANFNIAKEEFETKNDPKKTLFYTENIQDCKFFSFENVKELFLKRGSDEFEDMCHFIKKLDNICLEDAITAHYVYNLLYKKSKNLLEKKSTGVLTFSHVNLNTGDFVFKNLNEDLFSFKFPFSTRIFKNINSLIKRDLLLGVDATELKLHIFTVKVDIGMSIIELLCRLNEKELVEISSPGFIKNRSYENLLTSEDVLNESFVNTIKAKIQPFVTSMVNHEFSNKKIGLILNHLFLTFPCAIDHLDLSNFNNKQISYFTFWIHFKNAKI